MRGGCEEGRRSIQHYLHSSLAKCLKTILRWASGTFSKGMTSWRDRERGGGWGQWMGRELYCLL